MALYCFLRHAGSFADAVHQAIFIGGDTDTIASMTGALSGAFLGEAAIPAGWLAAMREKKLPAARDSRPGRPTVRHVCDAMIRPLRSDTAKSIGRGRFLAIHGWPPGGLGPHS